MTTKKYVVTLNNKEDLDDFYNDMESASSKSNIPDRSCNCSLRRNISRNTVYDLTDEEATLLKKDSRVKDVDLTMQDNGITVVKDGWSETAVFAKDPSATTHRNWGLKRCIDGQQTANWGKSTTDDATNYPNNFLNTSSTTVSTTSSGKNVDIIIAEDDLHASQLFSYREFWTKYPNGQLSPPSRIKYFDWFQYTSALGFNSVVSSSVYTQINTLGTDDHAYQVAVVAAGNSAGFARDANVYSIRALGSSQLSSGNDWTEIFIDYIRHFHKNKPVNTTTGRRNPTIVNMSWTLFNTLLLSDTSTPASININSIRKYESNFNSSGEPFHANPNHTSNYILPGETNYNNSAYLCPDVIGGLTAGLHTGTANLTGNDWQFTMPILFGVSTLKGRFNVDGTAGMPARVSALDADIADAIADGIIFVASAGNQGALINRNAFGGSTIDNTNQNTTGHKICTDVIPSSIYSISSCFKYDAKLTFKNYQNVDKVWEYQKGASPNHTDDVICVGGIDIHTNDSAIDTSSTLDHKESQPFFSNYGSRIDVSAPAVNIWTHQYSQSGADAVDNSTRRYYKKVTGTSYSAPLTVGVLACLLEQEPNLTPAEALQHLIENSSYGDMDKGSGQSIVGGALNSVQIQNCGNNNTQTFYHLEGRRHEANSVLGNAASIGDTANKYLAYKKKRKESGSVYPRNNFKNRNIKLKTAHSFQNQFTVNADHNFMLHNRIFPSIRGNLTSSPKYPRVNSRVTKAYS